MDREAAKIIKRLGLESHPEGGYFRETYKSEIAVNSSVHNGPRSACTAIYYMLAGKEFSSFHRLKSDEIWHHYVGGPITLYAIDKNGKMSMTKIGSSNPQAIVKANTWFATALDNKRSYCLAGCTMAPGFDYRDWELGRRDELCKLYPRHKEIIERYTK